MWRGKGGWREVWSNLMEVWGKLDSRLGGGLERHICMSLSVVRWSVKEDYAIEEIGDG